MTWTQVASTDHDPGLSGAGDLAERQADGWPVPQLHLGTATQIVAEREQALMRDPAELQVQEIHAQQAREADPGKLQDVPAALSAEQSAAAARFAEALKGQPDAPLAPDPGRREAPRRFCPAPRRGRGTAGAHSWRPRPAAPNPLAACSRTPSPLRATRQARSAEQERFDNSRRNFIAWCA